MPRENQVITPLTLLNLQSACSLAADKLKQALQERWPEGTEISCFLSGRQQTPSRGTIRHHRGDGTLLIELYSCSRRGYRTRKNVHWSRCT